MEETKFSETSRALQNGFILALKSENSVREIEDKMKEFSFAIGKSAI